MSVMIDRAILLSKLFPNGIPKRNEWSYSIPARTVYLAVMDTPGPGEERFGRWINVEWLESPMRVIHGYQCSKCAGRYKLATHYCPSCGRNMIQTPSDESPSSR